jgi:hypothetical protein
MTIEDTLDLYENRDGEVEELLARVIRFRRVKSQSCLTVAEAYLRFEQSLSLLRELDEEMHLARGDLIVAARRVRALFTRKRPREIRRWLSWLMFSWIEFRNSCGTYRLFVVRAYQAMRAALSLIFLRE